jgi:hypothetical protein
MSTRVRLALMLTGSMLLSVPAALCQEASDVQADVLDQYVKTMRGDLTARRDAALRAVLQLNDEEGKAFWPLQQAYDKERIKIGDQRRDLLREWGKASQGLTPGKANELVGRYFKLEQARLALRQSTFEKISAAVSPVVAAQFLQIQSQFEAMGDVQLATYVPLAIR